MYGDRQEIFVLLSGPKSKFLSFEYSTRLLSIKFINFLWAKSLLGDTKVKQYEDEVASKLTLLKTPITGVGKILFLFVPL